MRKCTNNNFRYPNAEGVASGLFFRAFSRRLTSVLLILMLLISIWPNASADTDTETAAAETSETVNTGAVLSGGPDISSAAAIVMEVNSGAVLYAKKETAAYEPASLTKLLTCLLAMENLDYDSSVQLSYTAVNGIGTGVTRIGLVTDERLPVRDLLYASLVASADEATYALAEEVSSSMTEFLAMMNKRVANLGGVNSDFTNCMGLSDGKIYSCAYDLGLVACRIAQMDEFYTIAGSKWYGVPATNKMEARVIAQTHKFIRQTLNYAYAKAGKSGGEDSSGTYSLCTYAEKDGMTLVAIVLGSPTNEGAYEDSVTALNWAFENYEVYSVKEAEAGTNASYTGLFDNCDMFVQASSKELVYTSDTASIVLPIGSSLSDVTKSTTYYELSEYFHGENVIGAVVYHYKGSVVGKMEIIFWNDEYPMSQSEFDAVWPDFLIPPSLLVSQGGTGELPEVVGGAVTPTPLPYSDLKTETEDSEETEAETEEMSVGSLTPSPTVTPSAEKASASSPDQKKAEEEVQAAKSHNRKAKLLAIALFVLTYAVCLIYIYIIRPIRRKKRKMAQKRIQR